VLSFTLFSVNRNAQHARLVDDADEYEKLDAGIGMDGVRNYVVVRYMDASFGIQRVTSPVTPTSASITRYGLRTMVIDLAASTTITDQTTAGAFADAIRSDLEFPIIEQQFTGHGSGSWSSGTTCSCSANGMHYDEDQFGGVTSLQHTFANGN
jgi:hypothetical protein